MKLILSNDAAKSLAISAELRNLTTSERIGIGARKSGVFILLAVGSIFLPVLHFFLVPAFLIGAVVVGVTGYRNYYELIIGNACSCLKCHGILNDKFFVDESLSLKCVQCGARYVIDRDS
jgi:hypothetical protein